MPISRPSEAKFRGPTSSNDHNRQEDSRYYDLIELYNQSNKNDKNLKEAYQSILSEHVCLQSYVRTLESVIEDLEKKISLLEDKATYMNGSFFKTVLYNDMTSQYPDKDQNDNISEGRATIDRSYRFAALPVVNEIPKTYVEDIEGNPVLPESLEIEVTRESESGTVVENDIKNAFDGDLHTYWRREVSYRAEEAPSKEEAIVEVTLPASHLNSLNLNTIIIDPHPELGIEITNLEIHHNDSWVRVEGFRQQELNGSISLSPKRKWYFAEKPVKKIRVTLTQRNPMTIQGKRVFVLGAKTISAYMTTFDTDSAIVLSKIDMSDVGAYSINKVEHIISNANALTYSYELGEHDENLYEYTLMQEESGVLIPIDESQWSNQIDPQIWVKTTLKKDRNNGVTPCLHAVQLKYTKL